MNFHRSAGLFRGRRAVGGRFIALVVAAVWAASTLSACSSSSKLPTVELSFERGGTAMSPQFTMEVCSTPKERSLGLMYRKSLPENSGMLFIFPTERENVFWMKNTFLSLDMVFVSRDGRVVGVLEDVPPLNEERRTVGAESLYVLEFAAGTMRKHGVSTGATVRFHGELPRAR